MPQSTYTPFLAQAAQNIGGAYMGMRQREDTAAQQAKMQQLSEGAYMGDPQALAQLAAINPRAAQSIQTMTRQRQQDEVSRAGAQREMSIENREIVGNILVEAAKLPTFKAASDYAAREAGARIDVLGPVPPLTRQAYDQMRQIAKPPAEEVSALDVAKTAETEAKTAKLLKETEAGPKKAKKTVDEAKASGFYQRMIADQGEIDRVLEENPDFEAQSLWEAGPAKISNVFASTEFQQYRQAADDWIRAKLRRESGAVIATEEMDKEYSTYFPVFGDSEKVIKQKQRARKIAEKAMGESGNIEADTEAPAQKSIKRRGTYQGRQVIEYADGTVEYAD